MTSPENPSSEWSADVSRVSQEMASRLRARGVEVYDADSPDDILRLIEGVEEFERAVQSRGGDLMVDEPPGGGLAQPDDPHFVLPKRGADESISVYLRRLRGGIAAVRQHPPVG